jgi:cell division protein FtsN
MMEQITQSLLMARGIGGEDWTNLLFIVVMAVLWLAAGLIKMIAKKGSPPEQSKPEDSPGQPPRPRETWQQRLARKAEEIQRRFEEEAGVREPGRRRPPVRDATPQSAQTPGGSPGRRDEPATRPQPQAAIRRDHRVARRETSDTAAASLTSIPAETPEPLKPDDVRRSVPGESGGFELAAVIDYRDPDALKKAVLHYEILGKPLALRESPGETIAF